MHTRDRQQLIHELQRHKRILQLGLAMGYALLDLVLGFHWLMICS